VLFRSLLYGSTSELATLDGKLVKEIIDSELK
jgi:hypothetical protein